MNPIRTSVAAVLAALALAAVPATAVAHDGDHPFKNCPEAYENGYANIPASDEHYGKHLDRDGDGVGCDKPPAGFEPRDDEADSTGGGDTNTGAKNDSGTDLAETGGDDTTPYIAAAGAVVVLAGGGIMIAARKRRDAR
ncbi:excalibur calcium-binding domain-containing protein [Streptomyces sp. 15-116A]|uniref:excalibur calcium-binding domain-containing protein n=1 Tax=Streptomyces sp. 15-116A TaxID=2259035 RepID=UPI0021B25240|nr:excalibur calcium-binding domain-containing protein [Streptomyces sp. 15-116A]MCT7351419.1 excalibur calcium-binding domain-containing protein [Streptomyces sp. 15-116A]